MSSKQVQKIVNSTKKDFPKGISPYGADAIRFTFCSLASGSRDINFDLNRVEGYRNFCNKLWNASRFIILQCNAKKVSKNKSNDEEDQWLLDEMNKTLKIYSDHVENYRFDLAVQSIYEFVWEVYCDWYIEFCKIRLQNENLSISKKSEILNSLVNSLESILVALHPIIPFITEEIWQQTKSLHKYKDKSISLRNFPKITSSKRSFRDIELLKNSIVGIRNLRAEMQLSPKIEIDLILIKKNKTYKILNKYKNYLSNLCGIKNIMFLPSPPPSSIVLVSDEKLFVPLKGLIDPYKEIARNSENLSKLNKNFENLKSQLQNKKFLKNAPKLLVKERKLQLKDLSQKISKTIKHLKVLEKV